MSVLASPFHREVRFSNQETGIHIVRFIKGAWPLKTSRR